MTILLSSDHIWFCIIVAINRAVDWKLEQKPYLCFNINFSVLKLSLSEKFIGLLYRIYIWANLLIDHRLPISLFITC